MENVSWGKFKPDPSRLRTKFVSGTFNGLVKIIVAVISAPTTNVSFSILTKRDWLSFQTISWKNQIISSDEIPECVDFLFDSACWSRKNHKLFFVYHCISQPHRISLNWNYLLLLRNIWWTRPAHRTRVIPLFQSWRHFEHLVWRIYASCHGNKLSWQRYLYHM